MLEKLTTCDFNVSNAPFESEIRTYFQYLVDKNVWITGVCAFIGLEVKLLK